MKIISVFGTRPEAIKMAPLIKLINKQPSLNSIVTITAQHREMLDQVLDLFNIQPNYDLDLMKHNQTLEDINSIVLQKLAPIFENEKPDLVLVHGDTTTTMAAALTAYYHGITIGHVEAGLRSGNKFSPFPEEMNRKITGILADIHFAPTHLAANNLRQEGIDESKIYVTGNTVIDALFQAIEKTCDLSHIGLDKVNWEKNIILLTCHRRENWGDPMQQIFKAINDILHTLPDTEIIFPIHKNPLIRKIAYKLLGNNNQVHFCEPLEYLPFCHIMKKTKLVITDSGGLQEEAPALGIPVLVLRDITERPEAIEAGTAILAGTHYDSVFQATKLLLTNSNYYEKMAHSINPYGDGHASEKIIEIICSL